MSSIIEGYNYDIFISYRQKDNKHDGWVTEFVNNLKGELESTFKEEISVYFDINPHDGLLETHDVDASLKEKLKCLIFIPIISRTYCDPKSFAWEHEFKAFVEMASKDRFGLKVKLPNGNVASRVLPVKIHTLELSDIKLCEEILNGHLRGIDCVYEEPGVNRPLVAHEENPHNNLNHSVYRNQINKVANSINEIITSLQNKLPITYKTTVVEDAPVLSRFNKRKSKNTLLYSILVAIAITSVVLVFLKLTHREVDRSVAVLPFINDNPDTLNIAFTNGLMEEITLRLQSIKALKVPGRSSVEKFRGSKKSTHEISKLLGVNYLVEGSCQNFGNNLRLRIRLIDGKKDRTLWNKPFSLTIDNLDENFRMQISTAESIAAELNALLSPDEELLIKRIPTSNIAAYRIYRVGKEAHLRYQISNNVEELDRAGKYFREALEYDPGFALAYSGLAWVYKDKNVDKEYFKTNFLDSVLILSNKALEIDSKLAEAHYLKGEYFSANADMENAQKEYENTININPNDWMGYYGKGQLSSDHLMRIENLEKAVFLNQGPEMPMILKSLSSSYTYAGFFDKAHGHLNEWLNLTKDSTNFYYLLNGLEYAQGNYSEAIEALNKGLAKDSTNVLIIGDLGFNYGMIGRFKESLYYTQKYIRMMNEQGLYDLQGTLRIGYTLIKSNLIEDGNRYLDTQLDYCNKAIASSGRWYEENRMAYYDIAAINAFRGNKKEAYHNLRTYTMTPFKFYPILIFLKYDPFFDSLRGEPEFEQIVKDYESGCQIQHERVRKWLLENKMM